MKQTLMQIFQEGFRLFFLKIEQSFYGLIDFIQVAFYYYSKNFQFMKADLFLRSFYLFDSPYSISKRFSVEKKEHNLYTYGETLISSIDIISKTCEIEAYDHVFELGCGIGRTCFWLHFFIRCKVTGIDYIGQFISRANKIKERLNLDRINFIQENYLNVDLTEATVIYLYGTTLDEIEIEQLIEKFKTLQPGTKVITVSYPLTDYCSNDLFELMKCFSVKYPWGSAEIYMQIKK